MKNKIVNSQPSALSRLSRNLLFKKSKVASVLALLFMLPSMLFAQADSTRPQAADMATAMRSNGKIYVVVAVLVIILLGIFLYLIRLDRKISRLEKEQ